MRNNLSARYLAFFFTGLSLVNPIQAAAPDCRDIAEKVKAAVTAKRERVLIIVEDSIIQSDACACEIVKAAITAARAQPNLVGQIVFTAATACPAMASTIAECAVAVAPDAAANAKAAVIKALEDEAPHPTPTTHQGGKESVTDGGKGLVSNGKNPLPKGDAEAQKEPEFGGAAARIGGVYLFGAGGGGGSSSSSNGRKSGTGSGDGADGRNGGPGDSEESILITRTKTRFRVPVKPVTHASSDSIANP
jgi:hypothetical protein